MNQQLSLSQGFHILWVNCRRGGWLLCTGLLLLTMAFYAGDTAWAGSANAPLGQTNPPASTLVSDDFNACTLNSHWQFIDPLGDSTLDSNGEQVVISVPAGIPHDVWQGNMNAPRLLQSVNNTNFEAEVKFESAVTRRYQLQGLLALEDVNNLLRFNFQSDTNGTRLLVVSFTSGIPTILASEQIEGGAPLSMRVRRIGNSWTISYSYDNITWETKPSLTFTESLTLTQFGPFVGNAGPSPAFTSAIDYFFNTASPISPEDPAINTIPVNIVGSGRVDKSCGSPLRLNALPDLGWTFSGWSGALTGNQNPDTLAITGSEVVTATFVPKPLILNIQINGGGSVTSNPDQIYFDNGEMVTLTAIPNSGWVFDGWTGDLSGDEVAKTLTMTGNKTVTANFRLLEDKSNITSDDFNSCTLNTTRWGFTNPQNDADLTMTGNQVKIAIPGGVDHDVWTGGNRAPRLMQVAANEDFSIETKFESVIDQRYQMQGILVEENAGNFLRVNFQHDGSNTQVFAASFTNGAPQSRFNHTIPDGVPHYLRVVRSGNGWGIFYSFNGEDWNTNSAMAFTFTLNVTKVGVFVGNAADNAEAPPHTGIIDYFFNSASPITPEDPTVNTLPPITVVGEGDIVRSPACGNPVELTAVPAANWRFVGWSGDLTGNQNPVTVTAKGTERITATFAPISGIQSDDFGSCEIDDAWTFINPKNDAVYNRIDNQKIAIVVPADVEHDVFPNGVPGEPINRAPRLMQPATNVDFEIEAKFESDMSARFQLQGLIVEQDADDFLRFDYNHNGTTPAVTVIGFTNGVPKIYGREEVVIAAPMYLRVHRNGNAWTLDRSANGTDWTTTVTFTHVLSVSQVGFFAGNAGLNPSHTAIVDYFFENRNRIDPEDGSGSKLTLDKTGNGTVTATPSKQIYSCDDQVQIQATAAAGWTFTGWSGGLTGSQNPATVMMSSSKAVTAIFKENQFNLNLDTDGGEGSETPGTTTASDDGPYHEGQVVTLTAVPQTGYRFVKWVSGANEYTEAEIEVTISANATFTAVFEKIPVEEVMHKIYMPIVAR